MGFFSFIVLSFFYKVSYILVRPVTQGHDGGGCRGWDSTQLQRHHVSAEFSEGGEALLVPSHGWLVSLRVSID